VGDALDRLRDLPFEDIGFAKLDHHRALRTGMPEVIFAAGKTPAQVAEIFARMAAHGSNVLATRASAEMFRAVRDLEAEDSQPRAQYHESARCITLTQSEPAAGKGTIAVVCAGTSDLPVAEEAAITADGEPSRPQC
jgi:NCAIR mutase (PurE)-related protein